MSGRPSGVRYAEQVGAEVVQVFTSNPRGWARPTVQPAVDEALGEALAARRIPVFVHVPYLVNLASPTETTRARSAEAVAYSLERGRRLGARGVVLHAGSAVDAARDAALQVVRELLLPLLDRLDAAAPRVLIEPTAGGGQALAATVDDLAPIFQALDAHPKLGVCLDTCHALAAGHDLVSPGGIRTVLNQLLRAVGRGRLGLVHANDSKDGQGSHRDRHARIGDGTIGVEPFAELFRHPATRGVPVVIETPGTVDAHASDIATLKSLRDR
jgi:deoxyribonuclease-4